MQGSEVLVARGRPRHAWRAVAGCLLTGLVVGVVVGTVLAVAHRGDGPGGYFLGTLAVTGFGFGGAAVIYGLAWAAWPGGVRYAVVGTRLVVHRWGARVGEVDVAELDEVLLAGRMTWARAFLSPTLLGGLPQVVGVRHRPDSLFGGTTELPHVLLWGAAETDAFHEALADALRRHGVTTPLRRA